MRAAERREHVDRDALRRFAAATKDLADDDILDHLLPVAMPVRAEQRAREVQALLVRRGQHRGVSIPDLILAAIADIEQLIVLHYDHDFDLIAEVAGQRTEWVVPRGSID